MSAWYYKGRLCDKCTTRLNHILLNTEISAAVQEYRSRITPLKRSIDAKIEFSFDKSGRGKLKDAFLIMQDGTSYICEKIDWRQQEQTCIENNIEILFSWKLTGTDMEGQARYLHVIWEDDTKTHNLYVFYVGNFAMNDVSDSPIMLSDFYPKINYCEYLVERATGEEKETLQIIVEKRDSRISVVLCVMNLSWLYVRKVYDEYYVCEDGRYYNRDKSKLIAVILPKEKQMVNANTLNVLPNIGPILCQQLNTAGFLSVEDLMRKTTEEIWSKLYEVYPSTDYIEIYAIDCAKKGIWMRDMEKARKQVLKAYVSAKKQYK